MKHICKVMSVEVLPDFRPLIALDIEGNVIHTNEQPIIPPTPTIFYYEDGTTSTSDDTVLRQSSYNRNKTLARIEVGTCVEELGGDIISGYQSIVDGAIIKIPSSVKKVNTQSFCNSSAKFYIYFESSTPTFDLVDESENVIGAFGGAGESSEEMNGILFVPAGSKTTYTSHDEGWETYADYIYEYGANTTTFYYNDGTISTTNDTLLSQNSYDREKTLVNIEISNSVTAIADEAFKHGHIILTNLTFPDSVSVIGENAFYGVSTIRNINFGTGITNIGYNAFSAGDEHPSLNNVVFTSTTPISLVNEDIPIDIFGMFATYTPKNMKIYVPEGYELEYAAHDAGWEILAPYIQNISDYITYTSSENAIIVPPMPEALPTIYANTYKDGIGTYEFKIPVTKIGDDAFYDCDTLTSINLSNTSQLGEYAFYGCNSLSSIDLGSKLTTIGDSVFCECEALNDITIPASVTNIGSNAFTSCVDWPTQHIIRFESATPKISLVDEYENIIYAFGKLNESAAVNFVIIVPAGSENTYAHYDAGWEYYAAHIQNFNYSAQFTYDDDTVTYEMSSTITESSRDTTKNLTNVVFSTNKEIRIEAGAFDNNEDFNTYQNDPIIIPSNIKYIGSHAFDICDSHGDTQYIKFTATSPTFSLIDGNNNIIYAFGSSGYAMSAIRLIVPAGCKQNYVGHDAGWAAYANNIIEEE